MTDKDHGVWAGFLDFFYQAPAAILIQDVTDDGGKPSGIMGNLVKLACDLAKDDPLSFMRLETGSAPASTGQGPLVLENAMRYASQIHNEFNPVEPSVKEARSSSHRDLCESVNYAQRSDIRHGTDMQNQAKMLLKRGQGALTAGLHANFTGTCGLPPIAGPWSLESVQESAGRSVERGIGAMELPEDGGVEHKQSTEKLIVVPYITEDLVASTASRAALVAHITSEGKLRAINQSNESESFHCVLVDDGPALFVTLEKLARDKKVFDKVGVFKYPLPRAWQK